MYPTGNANLLNLNWQLKGMFAIHKSVLAYIVLIFGTYEIMILADTDRIHNTLQYYHTCQYISVCIGMYFAGIWY